MTKAASKIVLLLLMALPCACKQAGSAQATADVANAPAGAEAAAEAMRPVTAIAGGPSLEFKLDGTLVEGMAPSVMIIYVPVKKEVNIRANTPAGLFAVLIDNVDGPGTYTIGKSSHNGAGIMGTSKMYEVKKAGTPFTVTIDSVDEIAVINAHGAKAISGSFQGKLMDNDGNVVDVTDGKFSTQ